MPFDIAFARRQTDNGMLHVYIVDATGRKIAAIWGKEDERERTAHLIVSACNAFGEKERKEG